MQGLFIFLTVVIVSTIIGAVTRWLRRQQEAEQERAAQRRASSRRGDRPPVNDIDRFLEEIDKLRRKGGAAPPDARPAAVVPPVSSRRVEPPPPFVTTAAPPAPRDVPRLEELPPARVVAAPAKAVPVVARRVAPPRPQATQQPSTMFGKRLTGLLASKESVAMAVVLQEVLGPPKCKRG